MSSNHTCPTCERGVTDDDPITWDTIKRNKTTYHEWHYTIFGLFPGLTAGFLGGFFTALFLVLWTLERVLQWSP